jgi:hypothetical protein
MAVLLFKAISAVVFAANKFAEYLRGRVIRLNKKR